MGSAAQSRSSTTSNRSQHFQIRSRSQSCSVPWSSSLRARGKCGRVFGRWKDLLTRCMVVESLLLVFVFTAVVCSVVLWEVDQVGHCRVMLRWVGTLACS